LKAKALGMPWPAAGLGTNSFGLAWLWNLRLDCVCFMANPIMGHDICNFLPGGQMDA